MFEFNAGKFIKFIEKTLLAVIALLTIVATLQEILKIYEISIKLDAMARQINELALK